MTRHGCTGRLRCAYEGFNGTLTGSPQGVRSFCQDLREYEPEHFENTDFKIVDGLRDNQVLRGLKVWHVAELVTYGFEKGALKNQATIENGGTHLSPQDWHDRAAEDNTVLIDVRNANENAIGRFQPLNDASRVLDPYMRTSTEFPDWVTENMPKLQKAKNIMMYCTGGIRCERASALLVQKGLPATKVRRGASGRGALAACLVLRVLLLRGTPFCDAHSLVSPSSPLCFPSARRCSSSKVASTATWKPSPTAATGSARTTRSIAGSRTGPQRRNRR